MCKRWDLLFISEVDAKSWFDHDICQHWCRQMKMSHGRKAMLIARCYVVPLIVDCKAHNRFLHLSLAFKAEQMAKLDIFAVHNAHGDKQDNTLIELSSCISALAYPRRVCVLGDQNVDLLPDDVHDPYMSDINRHQHHVAERCRVEAFSIAHNINIYTPHASRVPPPPPFHEFPFFPCVPISRVPPGERSESEKCSLLDFAMVTPSIYVSSWLDWAIQISDHAILGVKLKFEVPWRSKGHPTAWRPLESKPVQEWFANNPKENLDLHDFRAHISHAQDIFSVSRKQKANHIPDSAAWNFHMASTCRFPNHSQIYYKNGWDILVGYRREQAKHRLDKAAKSGKVLAKCKKF